MASENFAVLGRFASPMMGFVAFVSLISVFSAGPLGDISAIHYASAGVFYLFMVLIWFLFALGTFRVGTKINFSNQKVFELFYAPFQASLAFVWPVLIGSVALAGKTETGFMVALGLFLLSICLSTAILAADWTRRWKILPFWGMLFAGVGGPTGIFLGGWLTWQIFGENFLDFDPLKFI